MPADGGQRRCTFTAHGVVRASDQCGRLNGHCGLQVGPTLFFIFKAFQSSKFEIQIGILHDIQN
jgi:hypothetical protein